jgi:molybdopterin converting factor subunit 1
MRVRVRFFAVLRDVVGRSEREVLLAEPATPEALWAELVRDHPALAERRRALAVAVNRAYARFDTPLAEGDEVVFLPPVSGG